MRLATSMSSSPMDVYTRKSTRLLYGMVHDRHTHSVVSTLVERCVHAWRASSAHMIGGGFAKLPTANTSQQLPVGRCQPGGRVGGNRGQKGVVGGFGRNRRKSEKRAVFHEKRPFFSEKWPFLPNLAKSAFF